MLASLRRTSLRRGVRALSTSPPSVRGLMAGLTHGEQGMSFEAAYEVLGEMDAGELAEWEAEWLSETGQRLRFATRDVSVIDSPADDGTFLRSLHFNERVDVVQTCVAVDAVTDTPDHSRPPSLDAQSGTYSQGLALAIALHGLGAARRSDACRIGVLGAGACGLPAFLHEALPQAQVDAVEVSADVCAAARECFGIQTLEGSSRFRLHQACAFEWVSAAPPASLDVLLVDLEAGEAALASLWSQLDAEQRAAMGGELPLVAPPQRALSPEFVRACRAALAPGGVVGVNALGGSAAIALASASLGATLGARVSCAAPMPPPGEGEDAAFPELEQRLLFFGDGVDGAGADEMRTALDALPPLVDGTEEWLRGWTNDEPPV